MLCRCGAAWVGWPRPTGTAGTRRGSSPAPGRRRACRGPCRCPPATCSTGRGCSRPPTVRRSVTAAGRRTRTTRAIPAPPATGGAARGGGRRGTRPTIAPDPRAPGLRDDEGPGANRDETEASAVPSGPAGRRAKRQGDRRGQDAENRDAEHASTARDAGAAAATTAPQTVASASAAGSRSPGRAQVGGRWPKARRARRAADPHRHVPRPTCSGRGSRGAGARGVG